MASTIAAITTGIGGIVTTADATGNLSLLSGTSTVVAVTSAGAAVTGTMSVSGATTLTGGLNTPLAVTSGGTGVATSTGSGANVLGTSPTLTTPTISTITSAAATALTLQSASTTAVTIDTSQNVGIGTALPRKTLSINGGFAFQTAGGANRSIHWGDETTSIFPILIAGNATSGSESLTFQTNVFGSAATERMRIDSSGNVGIGTTNPTAKLVVLSGTSPNIAQVTVAYSGSNNYYDANLHSFRDGSQTEVVRINAGLLQFNSGYGSVATAYGCRAWVNFNSTGTVSIYGSGNCSSITDNGVGNFTFNFTTAMPDVNYSVTTGPTQSSSNTNGGLILVFLSAAATYSAPLVGSFRFINVHAANTALGDSTYNCLSVFR